MQSTAAVGVLILDKLLDAVALAYSANVDTGRLRWFMPSRMFIALRKLKDGQGQYLLQPDVTADAPFRLLGIPVLVTNRIPIDGGAGTDEASVVLADFSQIAVARDMVPSVKLLDQTYAACDQQAIRVIARYDAAPLNPQAVIVLRGVTSRGYATASCASRRVTTTAMTNATPAANRVGGGENAGPSTRP